MAAEIFYSILHIINVVSLKRNRLYFCLYYCVLTPLNVIVIILLFYVDLILKDMKEQYRGGLGLWEFQKL